VVELHVERRLTGGRGGLITKTTKGRRRQTVPIIEPLRPTLDRVTVGRDQDERLITGPCGGVATATWDDPVRELCLTGLVRQGQRHTALTWMADTGVDLHIVQRTAGHQDPTVRAGYLHPDVQAMLNAGTASRPGAP
jgi:integrase